MKILAFDTSMGACSAAVLDTEKSMLAEACIPMERGHAEALAPMISDVMNRSGLSFSSVDRIAVTTGPGTFTGVRIGLAMAQGLGLARQTPTLGLDSLSAIAAGEEKPSPLLVVSDARNDEVYAALFDEHRNVLRPPHVSTVSMAAIDVPPDTMVLGTAAEAVIAASQRAELVRSAAGDLPVASRFIHLAVTSSVGGRLSPLYLRAPDVKPQTIPLRKVQEIAFVPAGPESSALLAALHGECFDEGWTQGAFEDLLAMPGANGVIAAEHAEPVGFVLTRLAADEAEIITIGTRPSGQRRGVGRKLLEHEFTRLREAGAATIFLEVAASNNAARRLYAALDFSEVGRRKSYYRQAPGREDAIVMRKDLTR